ncbi:MAG: phage major capsid protein [Candidatus Peribacteraceae bacterium]|nr:phage major capsid protein [Candidatus Peribacteraceae bacterium]
MAERVGEDTDKKIAAALEANAETIMAAITEKFGDKSSTDTDAETKDAKELEDPNVDTETEKAIKDMEDLEKFGAFMKAVKINDKDVIKAIQDTSVKTMGELTGAAGGFLVSEELQAQIWRIEELQGLFRRQARMITMRKEKLGLNRLGSTVSVSWKGHGQTIVESSPTIERIDLISESLTGITVFEEELLDDADIDVANGVAELFAEEMGQEEDNQGFNGIGAPFIGIFNDPDVAVVTMTTADNTFEELIPDDLRALIPQLKPKALKQAAWYMHPDAWNIIQTLKQNSQYITTFANPVLTKPAWKPDVITDAAGTLWGYPVFLSEQLPDSSDSAASIKWIIFGNMDFFAFGDRKSMETKFLDQATIELSDGSSVNLAQTTQNALIVVERIAMAVGIPDAFVVLKTAAAT